MKTTINAVRFKADPKLEQFIMDKVSKIERFVDTALQCEVTLKVDKPEAACNKVAEISLSLPGQTLFNSKQADSFEEAVSVCVDTLKVQIEKYKERSR
ncbi:MAG: ribosome-associated translation inhibitor RaiA [Bacteroidales bacterium]|nr:ribosome-associated translation inhibitor RaiA [Bacteroidales bacterium]